MSLGEAAEMVWVWEQSEEENIKETEARSQERGEGTGEMKT